MVNQRKIFTSLKNKVIPVALVIVLVTMQVGMLAFASGINPELSSVQGDSMILMSSDYTATFIALTPGKNATELNFAWYSPKDFNSCAVQFAKKSDMEGDIFPIAKATTFVGTVSDEPANHNSNFAIVTGLEEDTEYIYRLGDGNDENWSPIYNYTTRKTDKFNFMFYGDAQIGAGVQPVSQDYYGWNDTLEKSINKFPNASFAIHAGDQIETIPKDDASALKSESQYNYYLMPELMKSLPMEPIKDYHEESETHLLFNYHFNRANASEVYGVTFGSGNSYFTYGNTLFMVLNVMSTKISEHRAFMEMAIAAEPDVKWKVVLMHKCIYSSGYHYKNTLYYRNNLTPVIDDLGIDVVLNGHDHVFTRSHQMLGDVPQLLGPQNTSGAPLTEHYLNENGAVINPRGTMYFTANSASGSKYYSLANLEEEEEEEQLYYVAAKSQLEVPTFTNINVTDNFFELRTYRTDTMERVDHYIIAKANSDEEFVEAAKDLLTFDELSDEEMDSVSMNLTLPTKWHETVVSWESSNPDIISTDGKVSYMNNEDTEITLTATITKNSISTTKEFVVTVLRKLGNSGISIGVDNQTKKIRVEGNYQFTGENYISIIVKDAEDAIKYLNQIKRNDDKDDF